MMVFDINDPHKFPSYNGFDPTGEYRVVAERRGFWRTPRLVLQERWLHEDGTSLWRASEQTFYLSPDKGTLVLLENLKRGPRRR